VTQFICTVICMHRRRCAHTLPSSRDSRSTSHFRSATAHAPFPTTRRV